VDLYIDVYAGFSSSSGQGFQNVEMFRGGLYLRVRKRGNNINVRVARRGRGGVSVNMH